ncbi:hypothetical protein QS423_08580 [Staphylococcus pseudintermedius]|nr:hypothetical protein QS423_08580 [Staphylococcus pseudintermedius]
MPQQQTELLNFLQAYYHQTSEMIIFIDAQGQVIRIGTLTDTDDFKVVAQDSVIERRTSELKREWEGAIESCMTSVD